MCIYCHLKVNVNILQFSTMVTTCKHHFVAGAPEKPAIAVRTTLFCKVMAARQSTIDVCLKLVKAEAKQLGGVLNSVKFPALGNKVVSATLIRDFTEELYQRVNEGSYIMTPLFFKIRFHS